MKKNIRKTKWLQFLIAMTAITIPTAAGALLVVACSNTDEQIQKQKTEIQEFAAAVKPTVKNSNFSTKVIEKIVNSENFDIFTWDFIEFSFPENITNYIIEPSATVLRDGGVKVFIQITHRQNISITTNISFEFKDEFSDTNSPQDDEYIVLYDIMRDLKLNKKPITMRVSDAVTDINEASFDPFANEIFDVIVNDKFKANLDNFTPTAVATPSTTNNTAVDIEFTLTSKVFDSVTKSKNIALDGFVYISPVELEREKLNQFVSSLSLNIVDKNQTLYDAVFKTNASDFDVLDNDVFALSSVTGASAFRFKATALATSLTSMEVKLTITSNNYNEVSVTKTYSVGEFVDGRISETQAINELIAKIAITKRSDALGKTLTVADALAEINQPAFDVFNNKVFSVSNAFELKDYNVVATASETSITSITIDFSIESKKYDNISAQKDFILNDFVDPKVTETSKIQALINKVSIVRKAEGVSQQTALKTIQSDGFDILANDILLLTYENENISPYIFSIDKSWTREDTMIGLTLKVTSKTYADVFKTRDIVITGFKSDSANIEEQKLLLAKFIQDLNLTLKSEGAKLDVASAISAINAEGFDPFNNDVFTAMPNIDATRFKVSSISAAKVTNTSIRISITVTSILFPEEVTGAKDALIDGFFYENPEENETVKFNNFMSKLKITKVVNELTVPQALAAVSTVGFDPLNNDVFAITPADLAVDFDLEATAVKVSETVIDLTLTVTSKLFAQITEDKTVSLTGFVDPKAVENDKLNTLFDEITITKKASASTLTVAEALTIFSAEGFDLFNNEVVTVSNETDIKAFNYTHTASRISDTQIKLDLTLTSKTYNDLTKTKTANLIGFNNSEILEQQKLNTLMNVVNVTKNVSNLTANQALAEINKSGFNIYSNSVFTLTPATDAQEFDVSITDKSIQNTNDIKLTFKFTSRSFATTVNATKDFTLANFKTEEAIETERLTELMAQIAFTKKSSDISTTDAVAAINASGFNIFSNDIFEIQPRRETIEQFIPTISATRTSDTEISISFTLTSKTITSVTQTKAFTLTDFTVPTIDGVTGTGINKIYTDKDVGTVYVGTAEKYVLGGKNFYGDPYVLNPFQNYGAEELDAMQANSTWPQIKQLIASSRPFDGVPDSESFLPPVGTPITFTDTIKSNPDIPNNVKRFISIIDEQIYNEIFYYRNAVYSYREFIKAIWKYPRILAEVNLDASFIKNNNDLKINGVLSPEKALVYIAKLEIASMFSHFMQETGAGLSVFNTEALIKENRPKQIPWNSNYSVDYVEPDSTFTNASLISAAPTYGITLANQTEIERNPNAVVPGTEKQALFYVKEAAYTDDTSEAARKQYTAWDLVSSPWTAAAFPPPIGSDGVSTVSYIGRGAKQLSWNYNYGPASRIFFGDDDADELLNNPSRVAKEGWLAIGTAIMFYMTPAGQKPSMHDAITGAWEPTTQQQTDYKWKPGFGLSINIINGGLELNADGNENNQRFQALNRQFFFAQNIKILGISTFASSSVFDNAGYSQTLFADSNIPTVNTDWTVSYDGAPSATLATWDTGAGFKVSFPGDYYRAWKAYQTSTFIEDWGINTSTAFAVKSADWKAGKNPTYTKVGPDYDWKNK